MRVKKKAGLEQGHEKERGLTYGAARWLEVVVGRGKKEVAGAHSGVEYTAVWLGVGIIHEIKRQWPQTGHHKLCLEIKSATSCHVFVEVFSQPGAPSCCCNRLMTSKRVAKPRRAPGN